VHTPRQKIGGTPPQLSSGAPGQKELEAAWILVVEKLYIVEQVRRLLDLIDQDDLGIPRS